MLLLRLHPYLFDNFMLPQPFKQGVNQSLSLLDFRAHDDLTWLLLSFNQFSWLFDLFLGLSGLFLFQSPFSGPLATSDHRELDFAPQQNVQTIISVPSFTDSFALGLPAKR
jgi:hypothetical protein